MDVNRAELKAMCAACICSRWNRKRMRRHSTLQW